MQETARINTFRALRRPEYYFRPSLLWRRIRRDSLCARNAVQLAWGLPIEVDAKAWIGIDIINIGTHDRVVPEAIWRLLDSGEQAIDIGANTGQNASIMALKSGPQGHVTAFEPGPEQECRELATLPAGADRDSAPGAVGSDVEIDMTTLDDYASFAGEIGLIKIDVEGHEGAVMEGAAMLLADSRHYF